MAASLKEVKHMDTGPTDSHTSTPRSEPYHHVPDDDAGPLPRIRFMCSYGGEIRPRAHDNQLRYVGGDTRIVVVHRRITFASLLSKLFKVAGTTNMIRIKYQLPNEDLDALITVAADEDVENMMEEYDRLVHSKTARLRLFLFDIDETSSRASSISSLLDGSTKRENWFVDALNGCPVPGPVLERIRSEVSSIVSDVPDYLFGLDNQDDDGWKEPQKLRNKKLLHDISISDPDSPAPAVPPFGSTASTSSSLAPPHLQIIPDLPPVKAKPVTSIQVLDNTKKSQVPEMTIDKTDSQQPVYPPDPSPIWHYTNPAMQPIPAVYYLPSSHKVQPGNVPVASQAQFVQPYQVGPGCQVPVAFPRTISNVSQFHGAGMSPYETNSSANQDHTSLFPDS